jgi:hypothetical protein
MSAIPPSVFRHESMSPYWLHGISVPEKCADDDHYSDLFILIHSTSKVLHTALSLPVLNGYPM